MDLIEEIEQDTRALQKLTEQSVSLEPTRITRKKIPKFTKIRSHAVSMFSTLQTGLTGPCQASHRASLYMSPLHGSQGLGAADEEHAFRVVLHHEFKGPPQVPSQWIIEEAEVRMLDAVAASKVVTTQLLDPPPTLPKDKKAVRWQSSSTPTTIPPATIPTMQQQQALKEIKDLCKSIQKLRASKCGMCLGYLQNQANAHRHGLYLPENPLVDRNALTSISSGSLLASSGQQASTRLSVADSRRLALALALGILRLHDTPWLTRYWSRDDITLFKQNNLILSKHPFV